MTLDETLTGLKSLILINTSYFLFVKEIKRTLIGMFAFVYNKRQEIKKKFKFLNYFVEWQNFIQMTQRRTVTALFFLCVFHII